MLPNTLEKCVSCGDKTQYTFDENIYNRNWYVEGAGQLCETCYNKTYSAV